MWGCWGLEFTLSIDVLQLYEWFIFITFIDQILIDWLIDFVFLVVCNETFMEFEMTNYPWIFFFVQIQEILELLFINQMYLRVMRFVQIIGVNCLFFMWKKREKKTRWKNQSIFDIKRQPASYVTNIWIRFNRERDREKKIIERIHIC